MTWIVIDVVLLLAFLGVVLAWYVMRDIAERLVNEGSTEKVKWKFRRPNASDRSLFGPS